MLISEKLPWIVMNWLQVTVRSGGPEQTVPVCRQCHKTCLANSPQSPPDLDDDTDCDDNWGPLMLMGMSALSATVGLGPAIVADPFSPTEVPMISILPPTPDTIPHSSNFQWDDVDMGRAEGNPHRLQVPHLIYYFKIYSTYLIKC